MRLKLSRTALKACILLVLYVTYVSARPSLEDYSEEVNSDEDNDDDDNDSNDDDDSTSKQTNLAKPSKLVASSADNPSHIENLKKLAQYLEKFIDKYITPNSAVPTKDESSNGTETLAAEEPKKPITVSPAILQSLIALLETFKRPGAKPISTLAQMPAFLEMLKPIVNKQPLTNTTENPIETTTLASDLQNITDVATDVVLESDTKLQNNTDKPPNSTILSQNVTEAAFEIPQMTFENVTQESTPVENSLTELASDTADIGAIPVAENATSTLSAPTSQSTTNVPQDASFSSDGAASQDIAISEAIGVDQNQSATAVPTTVSADTTTISEISSPTEETSVGPDMTYETPIDIQYLPNIDTPTLSIIQSSIIVQSPDSGVVQSSDDLQSTTSSPYAPIDETTINDIVNGEIQNLIPAEISMNGQDLLIPELPTSVQYPSIAETSTVVETPQTVETSPYDQSPAAIDNIVNTEDYVPVVASSTPKDYDVYDTTTDYIPYEMLSLDYTSSTYETPVNQNAVETPYQGAYGSETPVEVQYPIQPEASPVPQEAAPSSVQYPSALYPSDQYPSVEYPSAQYPSALETPVEMPYISYEQTQQSQVPQEQSALEAPVEIQYPTVPETSAITQDLQIQPMAQYPSVQYPPTEQLLAQYPSAPEAPITAQSSPYDQTQQTNDYQTELQTPVYPVAPSNQGIFDKPNILENPSEIKDPEPIGNIFNAFEPINIQNQVGSLASYPQTAAGTQPDYLTATPSFNPDYVQTTQQIGQEDSTLNSPTISAVDITSAVPWQSLSVPDPIPAPPIQDHFEQAVENIQPIQPYEPSSHFTQPAPDQSFQPPVESSVPDTFASPSTWNAMEHAEAEALSAASNFNAMEQAEAEAMATTINPINEMQQVENEAIFAESSSINAIQPTDSVSATFSPSNIMEQAEIDAILASTNVINEMGQAEADAILSSNSINAMEQAEADAVFASTHNAMELAEAEIVSATAGPSSVQTSEVMPSDLQAEQHDNNEFLPAPYIPSSGLVDLTQPSLQPHSNTPDIVLTNPEVSALEIPIYVSSQGQTPTYETPPVDAQANIMPSEEPSGSAFVQIGETNIIEPPSQSQQLFGTASYEPTSQTVVQGYDTSGFISTVGEPSGSIYQEIPIEPSVVQPNESNIGSIDQFTVPDTIPAIPVFDALSSQSSGGEQFSPPSPLPSDSTLQSPLASPGSLDLPINFDNYAPQQSEHPLTSDLTSQQSSQIPFVTSTSFENAASGASVTEPVLYPQSSSLVAMESTSSWPIPDPSLSSPTIDAINIITPDSPGGQSSYPVHQPSGPENYYPQQPAIQTSLTGLTIVQPSYETGSLISDSSVGSMVSGSQNSYQPSPESISPPLEPSMLGTFGPQPPYAPTVDSTISMDSSTASFMSPTNSQLSTVSPASSNTNQIEYVGSQIFEPKDPAQNSFGSVSEISTPTGNFETSMVGPTVSQPLHATAFEGTNLPGSPGVQLPYDTMLSSNVPVLQPLNTQSSGAPSETTMVADAQSADATVADAQSSFGTASSNSFVDSPSSILSASQSVHGVIVDNTAPALPTGVSTSTPTGFQPSSEPSPLSNIPVDNVGGATSAVLTDPVVPLPSGAAGVAFTEVGLANAGLPLEQASSSPNILLPTEGMASQPSITWTDFSNPEELPIFDPLTIISVPAQDASNSPIQSNVGIPDVALSPSPAKPGVGLGETGLTITKPVEPVFSSPAVTLPPEMTILKPPSIAAAEQVSIWEPNAPVTSGPMVDQLSGPAGIALAEAALAQAGLIDPVPVVNQLSGSEGIALTDTTLANAGLTDPVPGEKVTPAPVSTQTSIALPTEPMMVETVTTATNLGPVEQLPIFDPSSIASLVQPTPMEPLGQIKPTEPEPLPLGELPTYEQGYQDLEPIDMTDIDALFGEPVGPETTTQGITSPAMPTEIIFSEVIPADAIPIISIAGSPASTPVAKPDSVVSFISPGSIVSTNQQFPVASVPSQGPIPVYTQPEYVIPQMNVYEPSGGYDSSINQPSSYLQTPGSYAPPVMQQSTSLPNQFGNMPYYPPSTDNPVPNYNQGPASNTYATGSHYNGYISPPVTSPASVSMPVGNYQTILDEGALVGPVIGPDGDELFPPPMIVEAGATDPDVFESMIAAEYLAEGKPRKISLSNEGEKWFRKGIKDRTVDEKSGAEVLDNAKVDKSIPEKIVNEKASDVAENSKVGQNPSEKRPKENVKTAEKPLSEVLDDAIVKKGVSQKQVNGEAEAIEKVGVELAAANVEENEPKKETGVVQMPKTEALNETKGGNSVSKRIVKKEIKATEEPAAEILNKEKSVRTADGMLQLSAKIELLRLEAEPPVSERGSHVERKEPLISCTDCVSPDEVDSAGDSRALVGTISTPGPEIKRSEQFAGNIPKGLEVFPYQPMPEVNTKRATQKENEHTKILENPLLSETTNVRIVDVPLIVDETMPIEIPAGSPRLLPIDPDVETDKSLRHSKIRQV